MQLFHFLGGINEVRGRLALHIGGCRSMRAAQSVSSAPGRLEETLDPGPRTLDQDHTGRAGGPSKQHLALCSNRTSLCVPLYVQLSKAKRVLLPHTGGSPQEI